MRYYIHKENGYVLAFGTGQGFEEIDEGQYSNLMNVIKNRPEEGVDYTWRLKTDMVWEKADMPVIEVEPDSDELLGILLGGLYE